MLGMFYAFVVICLLLKKTFFSKIVKLFVLDHEWRLTGSDLGPNCLQKSPPARKDVIVQVVLIFSLLLWRLYTQYNLKYVHLKC